MASAGGRVPVWLKAEDLQCSICLGLLRSPATLLCGHSFCGACIGRWEEAKAKCRGRGCPNCGRGLPKRLPERNVLLETLLQLYRRAAAAPTEGGLGEGHGLLAPDESEVPCAAAAKGGGVQDVVKIAEIPQQIEAAIEAATAWSRDSITMKDSVSQIKNSLREGFSVMRKYISHQEEAVLNFVDKEYTAAQQRMNLISEQLSARTHELLELQNNSEELMKTTSLDQEIHTGSLIEVDKAKHDVQKIYSMIQTVEEFKRQLGMSVLEKYPIQLLQEPSPGTNSVKEIHTNAAEGGTASSISSSKSQESLDQRSLQETSSCSSAVSPASDSPVPMIRSQYSQWASSVTFDLERLNHRLELSENKRKVIVSHSPLENDHSPKKFRKSQVLASQGFSEGCHYWEVNTRDCLGWAVGVARAEIDSSDKLGRNELSWCIEWSGNRLSAWHRNKETPISKEKPLLVGVFLDIPKKHLHFHSLTGKETNLHCFNINVANPVYPAFWIYGMDVGGSLTIRDVKRS
uniref:E3 ubiquitin-protein ligase RNF135 n=1 Tax=Salvator merianae TaxID=96440 RepID=A0A8D0DIQ8_SALMN